MDLNNRVMSSVSPDIVDGPFTLHDNDAKPGSGQCIQSGAEQQNACTGNNPRPNTAETNRDPHYNPRKMARSSQLKSNQQV
jgi:hypothetical protein